MRAKVPIYGSGDAATRLVEEDFTEPGEQQVESRALEPAMFYLWDGATLVGMCTTHVDDLLVAGVGKVYEESMKLLNQTGRPWSSSIGASW